MAGPGQEAAASRESDEFASRLEDLREDGSVVLVVGSESTAVHADDTRLVTVGATRSSAATATQSAAMNPDDLGDASLTDVGIAIVDGAEAFERRHEPLVVAPSSADPGTPPDDRSGRVGRGPAGDCHGSRYPAASSRPVRGDRYSPEPTVPSASTRSRYFRRLAARAASGSTSSSSASDSRQ